MQKALTLYNASAGSGKTFQLVKSILLLLVKNKDPYSFQKILALTFTNKAADEMKNRLIQWLTLLSDAKNQNETIFSQIQEESGLETEELAENCKKILSAILQRYSRLSIGTLDSFFNRLIRSFSKELGVNYQSEIVFDAKPYIKKAVGQLIFDAEKDENLKKFLLETVNSQMEREKNWNVAYDLEKSLSGLMADNQFDKIKPFTKFGFEQYSTLQNNWRKELKSLKTSTKEIGNRFLQLLDDNALSVEDLNNKSKGFAGFFIKLSNENFEHPSDSVENKISNQEFTTKTAKAEIKAAADGLSNEIKKLFQQAKENLKRISELNAFFNELVSLALLGGVAKRLDEQKDKQRFLFQSDVAKIISENLINQPSAYIYEKIGQRYSTIFIDEFQDTSHIQWQNLSPLIEEKSAYGQKTYLVGDPKQAIYRFRGGDQKIMVSLSNNPEVEIQNLGTNYRSYKAIVEFNNHFYQSLLDGKDDGDYKKIYLQGLSQESNAEKEGCVEVEFLAKPEKESDEKANEMVLQSVLQKTKMLFEAGYSAEDICVLVRTRKQAEAIAGILQENNFSVATDEALLLMKNTSIDLLVHFLYLMDEPREINKLEFISRFLAFYKYHPKEEISIFIKEFCKKDWSEIKNFLKLEGFLIAFDEDENLYSLIQNTISTLRLNRGAYLLRFLDYVEQYKNRNGNLLKSFLENWEEDKEKLSIESKSSANGVRVMTMHKSKGLEFPVVLMPFFGEKKNSNSVWLSYPDLPFEKYRITPTSAFRTTNALVEKELEEEKLSEDLDVLNLLYVSTTRAVEHMFLFVPENKSPMGDLITSYLKTIGLEPGETRILAGEFHQKEIRKETKPETNSLLLNNAFLEKHSIDFSADSLQNFTPNKAFTDRGNAWHKLLSFFHSPKDLERILQIQNQDKLLNKQDEEKLKMVLEKLSSRDDLKPLFDENCISYNEREFLLKSGEIIKPDRLVLQNQKWWILDYKTGEKSSKHKQQLSFYSQSLTEIGMEIEACLLIYLDLDLEVERLGFLP